MKQLVHVTLANGDDYVIRTEEEAETFRKAFASAEGPFIRFLSDGWEVFVRVDNICSVAFNTQETDN